MEPRTKLFYQTHVPQYVDITYPVFVADDREFASHVMCVATTPMKGAKLYIEFTTDNIDLDAIARLQPSSHTH